MPRHLPFGGRTFSRANARASLPSPLRTSAFLCARPPPRTPFRCPAAPEIERTPRRTKTTAAVYCTVGYLSATGRLRGRARLFGLPSGWLQTFFKTGEARCDYAAQAPVRPHDASRRPPLKGRHRRTVLWRDTALRMAFRRTGHEVVVKHPIHLEAVKLVRPQRLGTPDHIPRQTPM